MQIQEARHLFSQKLHNSSETPQLETDILIGHFTGLSKEELIIHPTQTISAENIAQINAAIHQRLLHIPISQIIGYKPFWTSVFKVNDQVLTPRPETEILLKSGIIELKSLIDISNPNPLHVWDLGTGSGAIGLSIAKEFQTGSNNFEIYLTDKSKAALAICQKNLELLGLAKVQIIESDLDQGLDPNLQFDLIVCNPPYIPEDTKPPFIDEEIYHEPKIALFSGRDGLDFYRRLLTVLPMRLKENGVFWGEIYPPNIDILTELVKKAGLKIDQVLTTSNNLPGFIRITKKD